jgi:hypothetical protein
MSGDSLCLEEDTSGEALSVQFDRANSSLWRNMERCWETCTPPVAVCSIKRGVQRNRQKSCVEEH